MGSLALLLSKVGSINANSDRPRSNASRLRCRRQRTHSLPRMVLTTQPAPVLHFHCCSPSFARLKIVERSSPRNPGPEADRVRRETVAPPSVGKEKLVHASHRRLGPPHLRSAHLGHRSLQFPLLLLQERRPHELQWARCDVARGNRKTRPDFREPGHRENPPDWRRAIAALGNRKTSGGNRRDPRRARRCADDQRLAAPGKST